MLSDDVILATNPERLTFSLGEATGGGPADGMELLVMLVDGWKDGAGRDVPSFKVVFGRKSAGMCVKAMASFLERDEADRDSELGDGHEDPVRG